MFKGIGFYEMKIFVLRYVVVVDKYVDEDVEVVVFGYVVFGLCICIELNCIDVL